MNAGIVADDDGVGDDISNGDLALADTGFSLNGGLGCCARKNRQRCQPQSHHRQQSSPAIHKARGVCFIMLITVGRSLIGSGIVVFEFLISGLGVPPVARF